MSTALLHDLVKTSDSPLYIHLIPKYQLQCTPGFIPVTQTQDTDAVVPSISKYLVSIHLAGTDNTLTLGQAL